MLIKRLFAMCLVLALLPVTPVSAAQSGSDTGGAGTYISASHVSVDSGSTVVQSGNTVISSEITHVETENLYVYGDYNTATLYFPRITEVHIGNNDCQALWNPTLDELSNTLRATIMDEAGIAILYDGYVDIERKENYKPYGATRAAEILGYDIYARTGEQYVDNGEVYERTTGGLYTAKDAVSYSWCVMHLYRAMGIEQVEYFVKTEGRTEETYDINTSPLVQYLSMPTRGVDLSHAISNVWVTRTNMPTYLELAETDMVPQTSSSISVGEFCALAHYFMQLYGEPVLTEQEMRLLLQTYGSELPYGLPSVQLEAVKYLVARGIVEPDLSWRDAITFETAVTILMRIKDPDSRLTFKDVQLTVDVGLLDKGYYPVEVAGTTAPIQILDSFVGYDTYTTYDYFVEVIPDLEFKSYTGNFPTNPFIGSSSNTVTGTLAGTSYMGKVTVKGTEYYHFTAPQNLKITAYGNVVYINTASDTDIPGRYALAAPEMGGGYWTFEGELHGGYTETSLVDGWEWHPLSVDFPAEYLDEQRKIEYKDTYDAQLTSLNQSSYGFSIRVYNDDLENIKVTPADGYEVTLKDLYANRSIDLGDGVTIRKENTSTDSEHTYFTLAGCTNKSQLSELLTCNEGTAYTSFPAFARADNEFLVSVDFLRSIGAVWEFTQTSEDTYYLGVKSVSAVSGYQTGHYTDVFIGPSYVIRGTQMIIYPEDRAVVWELDGSYYVDYAAVLGIQRVTSFTIDEGVVSLSRGSQLGAIPLTTVYTPSKDSATDAPEVQYLPTAWVRPNASSDYSDDQRYIYAPMTYMLANWIFVENQRDARSGLFTFFPKAPGASSGDTGELESMLGIQLTTDAWAVQFTPMPPLDASLVVNDGTLLRYTKGDEGEDLPDILYCRELDAYLIKPTKVGTDTTYGEWTASVYNGEFPLTSIVETDYGFCDWNFNVYQLYGTSEAKTGYSQREGVSVSLISSWTGEKDTFENPHATDLFTAWVPAAAGIPGLIGYPVALNEEVAESENVSVFSGVDHTVWAGSGFTLTASSDLMTNEQVQVTQFAIIHTTPYHTYLQSCGFQLTILPTSPISQNNLTPPDMLSDGAVGTFDWESFYEELRLGKAEGWLAVALLAVLSLLPRIFMFLFMLLLALALIAHVKPWVVFCDKIFDPYKFLTLGRQTVHTINVKMVVFYSLLALAAFGLFQNGTILDVIAWFARAVSGILER